MASQTCPMCGAKGHRIQPLTVESLAQAEALQRLSRRDGFQYCPTATCTVAWFHWETGEVVDKEELNVRVGMKETEGPRPICYCFAHDVAEIETDIRLHGQTDVHREIAVKCKQGLDRCEETNPQGSCCLGNVNRVVKAAKQEFGVVSPPEESFTMASDSHDCCAVDEKENAHD